MSKTNFETVFKEFLASDRAFVFYRQPNRKTIHCKFQNDDSVNLTDNLKVNGFVMSQFDPPLPAVYISDKNYLDFDYKTVPLKRKKDLNISDSENKTFFTDLVNKTLKAIASGRLKKLVVARNVVKREEIDAFQFFNHLLTLYPQAMVYYWHHPKAETWVGATPEQFFSLHSGRLRTTALAGTLPHNLKEEYNWGDKERIEQGLVRDTLKNDLESLFPMAAVKCSKTFTLRAGNLVHLCNQLSVEVKKINTTKLLKKLHPTPAVGGIPAEEGMRFLAGCVWGPVEPLRPGKKNAPRFHFQNRYDTSLCYIIRY